MFEDFFILFWGFTVFKGNKFHSKIMVPPVLIPQKSQNYHRENLQTLQKTIVLNFSKFTFHLAEKICETRFSLDFRPSRLDAPQQKNFPAPLKAKPAAFPRHATPCIVKAHHRAMELGSTLFISLKVS